jgi:beta-phosphoglucomutase-like phosphatase (HAD superfamily)
MNSAAFHVVTCRTRSVDSGATTNSTGISRNFTFAGEARYSSGRRSGSARAAAITFTTIAMTGDCVRSFTSVSFSCMSRSNDQAKNDRIGMNVLAIMEGSDQTRKQPRMIILDMDGVLIDTEPAWRAAEVAGWITDQVIAYVMTEGRPMPGVTAAVALFGRYGLRLAIASSSPPRLIDAVCDRLGLADIEVRCSAMDEVRGKPAPDVYLTAARRLGIAAVSCLALEDSPNGIASAKAAGMRCVALPDPLLAADPRYRGVDLVLESLTRLDEAALRRLGALAPG